MKRNMMYSLLAVALVGSLAATSAMAFVGSGSTKQSFKDDQAVRDALAAGDYDAFVLAVSAHEGSERFLERVDEEKFDRMVEHFLTRQAEREAIENRDYDAWVTAVSEHPAASKILSTINEDNFDTFVDMREAKQNGDYETARELADELGLPKFGHHGKLGHHAKHMTVTE